MHVPSSLDSYVTKMIEEVLKSCKEIRIFCLGNVNCRTDSKMSSFKAFKRIAPKTVSIFGRHCFSQGAPL